VDGSKNTLSRIIGLAYLPMLLDGMSDGIQTATVALRCHDESPLMAMEMMKSTMTGN
jgi:hypothetical protein